MEEGTLKFIKLLVNEYWTQGYDIYMVGGATRCILSKDTTIDYDLVTNASLDKTTSILEMMSCKIYFRCDKFGSIRSSVEFDNQTLNIDVSAFRNSDGTIKSPLINIDENTFHDDLANRDLTYNAIYYDFKNKCLLDYTNGISDFKNGIVRMIYSKDNPLTKRFEEDPLRILRVLRYTCKYNHTIDAELFDVMKGNKELARLSTEQFHNEILLMHKTCNFSLYLKYLQDLCLVQYFFPDLIVSVKKDLVGQSDYFVVSLATILKDNGSADIYEKLIKLCYNWRLALEIKLLIQLLTFDPVRIREYMRYKKDSRIKDIVLNEWIELYQLGDLVKKFVGYKNKIGKKTIKYIMNQGIYEDLDKELDRIEYENFIKN